MSGPRRLIDDPDFQWETGCDLADEAALYDGMDLGSLKERVLSGAAAAGAAGAAGSAGASSGVAPAAASAVSMKGVVGAGVALVAALGVGYWLGATQPAGTAVEQVAPAHVVEAPVAVRAPVVEQAERALVAPAAVEAERSPAVPAPGGAADEAEPVVAPPTEAPVAPTRVVTPTAPVEAAGTAEAPADDGGSAPAATRVPEAAGQADEAPRSDAAAGMAVYDTALQAKLDGALVEAANGFRAYLAAWPDGHLAREAELSLLECLFEEGSFGEAEARAGRLLADPAFADRGRELSLVRAESLILLDRCDEALAIVDGLERDARTNAVRRECKRRR